MTNVELEAPKMLEEVATLARAYIPHNIVVTVPLASSFHCSYGRATVAPSTMPPPPQH
jgi:hypothetical protein